jgi:phospholipid transport system transporter-binding protein
MFKLTDKISATIIGPLTVDTVTALWRQGLSTMPLGQIENLDLSQVTQSDSAGLALLLEWTNLAKKAGKNLQFVNFPPQLTSIAKSINVDALLQVKENDAEPTISADATDRVP